MYIPIVFLGLFLSNPHGGLGGYFYFLGLSLVLPFFLYREQVGYFSGLGDWIAALTLQFLYVFLVAITLRALFVLVSRSRKK